MGLASMYGFGTTRLKMGSLVISCSVSETHSYTADVTNAPIDAPVGGLSVDVSDHRHLSPVTLEAHGIISDSTASVVDTIIAIDANTKIGELPKSAVQVGYAALLDLFYSKDLFEVVTSLQRYPRMTMTKLAFNRDKDTGRVLDFNASMQQVRVAVSATVNVFDQPKAAPPVNKEVKPTAKAEETIDNRSALAITTDTVGGPFSKPSP